MADIRQKRVFTEEHKRALRKPKKPRTPEHKKNFEKVMIGNKYHWKGGPDRVCPCCGVDKVYTNPDGITISYCRWCNNAISAERNRKYRAKQKAEMQGDKNG